MKLMILQNMLFVHFMNLVGVRVVECTPEAASASTHRWEVLQSHTGKRIMLKTLSATRWSARYEAVHVLIQHFDEIIETFIIIEEDIQKNAITRQEAKGMRSQLERYISLHTTQFTYVSCFIILLVCMYVYFIFYFFNILFYYYYYTFFVSFVISVFFATCTFLFNIISISLINK